MSKKKNRERRQQQRRQRRAASQAERRKRPAAPGPAIPGPVLFNQDEAAAIASMMSGGSSDFAARFGAILLDTDQLLEEMEFAGLALDTERYLEVLSPLLAGYESALATVKDNDFGLNDDLWLEIRGRVAARLVQTDFRHELLKRSDQFIERARGNAGLEERWRSAVALKFLLEQPPAGDIDQVWSFCQLMHVLIAEAEQQIVRRLTFQETIAAATGREEPLSPAELLDALDDPRVFDRLVEWLDEHFSAEEAFALDVIQKEALSDLIAGEWLPELFSMDELAVLMRSLFDTIQRSGLSPSDPAFPILDMTRAALAEIISPEWYEALQRRIRREERAVIGKDKQQLERWLALELMVSGFEEDPSGAPPLLAALIGQFNATLRDDEMRQSLRATVERRHPDLTAAQLDELFS